MHRHAANSRYNQGGTRRGREGLDGIAPGGSLFDDEQHHEVAVAQINEKTEQHKKDIKQSLVRSSAMCEEAVRVGNDTNRELQKQGDTIDRIEEQVDHTNASLDYADTLVKSIGSVWSALNPWGKKKTKKPASSGSLASQRQASTSGGGSSNTNGRASGGYTSSTARAQLTTESVSSSQQQVSSTAGLDKDDEMLLKNISHNLGILKEQSLTMGGELDRQNKKLDELNPRVEHVKRRMGTTTRNIEKIL